jgi:hypothetical protein
MSKFYTFNQNNSGGFFEGPEYLIVEANSATEANSIAQEYCDVYFNGVNDGIDCDCCGDRWYPVYESDGSDVPSIYGNTDLTGRDVTVRSATGYICETRY